MEANPFALRSRGCDNGRILAHLQVGEQSILNRDVQVHVEPIYE